MQGYEINYQIWPERQSRPSSQSHCDRARARARVSLNRDLERSITRQAGISGCSSPKERKELQGNRVDDCVEMNRQAKLGFPIFISVKKMGPDIVTAFT